MASFNGARWIARIELDRYKLGWAIGRLAPTQDRGLSFKERERTSENSGEELDDHCTNRKLQNKKSKIEGTIVNGAFTQSNYSALVGFIH